MSENWDFYMLQVDDKPAAIFVDLAARESAPNAALPHVAEVGKQGYQVRLCTAPTTLPSGTVPSYGGPTCPLPRP